MDKIKIQPTWRRRAPDGGACVGGDCDTVFPPSKYKGRAGHPVILEVIADPSAFGVQPAPHEALVFIPDDVRAQLG
jgi:hypothetical protein